MLIQFPILKFLLRFIITQANAQVPLIITQSNSQVHLFINQTND